MAGFIDEEAELGSENEDNDDRVHRINKGEADEDEDGLDSDLDSFIHVPDENDEIQDDPNADIHARFMDDLKADELRQQELMIRTGIFGRKRGIRDLEDEEEGDLDESDEVKRKRLQEREAYMHELELRMAGDPEAIER
jgi:hypothetical protein